MFQQAIQALREAEKIAAIWDFVSVRNATSPRGERYELCRSVHAEANAIIHASREQMIGATLYLVGKEMSNGEYVQNTSSCAMCKRMVINAGIDKVIVRNDKTDFTEIDVNDWIMSDDSLDALRGY